MGEDASLSAAYREFEEQLLQLVRARGQILLLLERLPGIERDVRGLGLKSATRALEQELQGASPPIDYRALVALQGDTNEALAALRESLTSLLDHIDSVLDPWLEPPAAG